MEKLVSWLALQLYLLEVPGMTKERNQNYKINNKDNFTRMNIFKVATHVTACCACMLRTCHQCSMHLFSSTTTRLKHVHSI